MKANRILANGYFPYELPPPFNTKCFLKRLGNIGSIPNGPIQCSELVTHNLARRGSLRRKLSIPNPQHYLQLAKCVEANWPDIKQFGCTSKISYSNPRIGAIGGRSIVTNKGFSYLQEARSFARGGKKITVITDISNFYSSVYTHSIPWAIHTKTVAKKKRNDRSLIGNQLDFLSRNLNDQQTVGIPIGPDTSLLLAEIILNPVDKKLQDRFGKHGFRFVDDYEFCFSEMSKAEDFLACIQKELSSFELQLNPKKTIIEHLPVDLEPPWISELRRINVRPWGINQKNDLITFFSIGFNLLRKQKDEPIVKYMVKKTSSVKIHKDNYKLYESLLLQCASIEPGALSTIYSELLKYKIFGYKQDLDRIQETINEIVQTNGIYDHGSEVAWAIWLSLILEIRLNKESAKVICNMDDSVVALLALDANANGLLSAGFDNSKWDSVISSPQELYGDQWLLVYESVKKQWLPSHSTLHGFSREPFFKFLFDNDASFYDSNMKRTIVRNTKKSLEEKPSKFLLPHFFEGGGGSAEYF